MPRFDPEASLRIWAVETTLGEYVLKVPAVPAADWLPVLMSANPVMLLEMVEDFDLTDAILDGGVSAADVHKALLDLIEAAAGRKVRVAFGIAMAASERWDVLGADLARAGVRFDEISLGAALDAIYGSIMRHMPDEKAIASFNRVLDSSDGVDESVRRRIPKDAKPLPASALQYAKTRPKTVLRRPSSLPDGQSGEPMPQPGLPADSAQLSGVDGSS